MHPYQGPMQPYPGLSRWSRQVELPSSGIRLFLYDTGDESKPPIIFIHGLGDEADTWRHILPQVSEGYRALAPDLPGFGRSDQANRDYTIPFFASTLLELLDTLSIQRAVIVGHSAGAVIAQAIALEHPERVERLVLIGGSLATKGSQLDPAILLFLVPGLGEWVYNQLRKDPQVAYRTLEPYYHHLADLPQADRDFLFQRVNERVWSDGQRRGFLSTLRSLAKWVPAQQKGLPERLRRSGVPVTVIWGENDQVNAVASAHALVEMLPDARLVIQPGAGHNLQQEHPEAILSVLR